MTVGERIAHLRIQRGYSQAELAKRIGVMRQTLSKYEKNETDVKLVNAMCIADVLGGSLDYLAGREGGAVAQYAAKYAVCPFYLRHEDNRICCEGIDEANTINLVFEDAKQQRAHGLRYCSNIDGYKDCRVCQMLDRKYPDK